MSNVEKFALASQSVDNFRSETDTGAAVPTRPENNYTTIMEGNTMAIPDELRDMMHGNTEGSRPTPVKTVEGFHDVTVDFPKRFTFELNVGTGSRDILDADNKTRYFPLEAGDAEATELCALMNKFPKLADSYEWLTERPSVKQQVESGIRAIQDKMSYANVTDYDPTKPLRELAEMLRERGIR